MADRQRPLKIVYCIDGLNPGGTELNAVRTADMVQRTGADVRVVLLGAEGPLLGRYEALGIPITRIRLSGFLHPSIAPRAASLARYLAREQAQILHAHDIYSNVFAVPVARLAGVPGVIASRRWWHHAPRESLLRINRQAYRFAHRVLANSEAVAGLLHTEEGVPSTRIAVVPNFVDDCAFEIVTDSERLATRRAWGVPEDGIVVGAVARLEPVKRLERLVDAVSSANEPRLHLVFVGDGSQRVPLEARAAALGIGDRVHFTGHLPQHPNPHQFLDISALTSDSEGFPNTLVEAMAAGRPILATNVGGVSDAVRDGETGLLVGRDDAAGLAKGLRQLATNEGLRARLGEAGRAAAFHRYRADATIGGLLDLYVAMNGQGTGRQAS